MPISAVDSVTLALEHTRQQLFKPFRIGQWTKLAFVGLLAGELGSGGCNRSNFQFPQHPGGSHPPFPHSLGMDPALLAAFVGAVVIAALAVGIILMYVGSVMRFILFDSVIARECHVRWAWNRRLGPGWQYFVWKLLYILFSVVGIGVVVGIPLAMAFARGWLRAPKEHLPPLAIGGIILFLVLLIFFVVTAVIFVLTKDFVVPQMALEGVDVMDGWRRLWPMMEAETGTYAAYIGMKIVLAFVAAILIGIATVILGLLIAVPSIGLGVLAVLTGRTAGLTWNPHTIALAIVIGCVLLAVFLYLVALIYVPAIVFFRAYSIHFFADRYPRLRAVLYSTTAAPRMPGGAAVPSP